METHVIAKRDSDDRVYSSVIVAPDHDTARRLFAMDMLSQQGRTLKDAGEPSLAAFAHEAYLEEDWRAGPGKSCPCCSSKVTRPMNGFEIAEMGVSPVTYASRCHLCRSCAHVWLDVGRHETTRNVLEHEAREGIGALEAYEETSILGDE